MVERIGWCCATSGVFLTVCLKERVFREVRGFTFIFMFSNQLKAFRMTPYPSWTLHVSEGLYGEVGMYLLLF
jgi:hypothetical protein